MIMSDVLDMEIGLLEISGKTKLKL